MKKPVAYVTDHALLRYLERVLQIDVEQYRREIGRKVDVAMEHEGATGVVVDGFVYKLCGVTVTTVVERARPERGQHRSKSAPRSAQECE